jgi:hypothetical protein
MHQKVKIKLNNPGKNKFGIVSLLENEEAAYQS